MRHAFLITILGFILFCLILAMGSGFMFGTGMLLSLLFGPELAMPFTGYWTNLATAIALLAAIWPASIIFGRLYNKIDNLSMDQVFNEIRARNKPPSW